MSSILKFADIPIGSIFRFKYGSSGHFVKLEEELISPHPAYERSPRKYTNGKAIVILKKDELLFHGAQDEFRFKQKQCDR
ncbi:MAG: hypothetical protein J7525_19650 [Roseofilum sp. SID3]|uniref:hypothetical protein n=1 Tax=Roseofilum sp. SID3 TaxID=2821499 RepID=UPI001B05F2B2|nr:hypothetical protein [Roseofilum sp. SID3]MBP0015311.1 hypothetical protein [Roseofilum sp. SID3]